MKSETTMKSVQLFEYSSEGKAADLRIEEATIPELKPGQVLIRMAFASINPSDLAFLTGQYGIKKKLPVVPGFEGSGTVIASGGGWSRLLIGRRVACASSDGDGTWSEFMVTDAKNCIPLRGSVSLEQATSLIVNPLTAIALIEMAENNRHSALIQTAAASALGSMIRRLAAKKGIPVINIVRRDEQIAMLENQGAEHILNSNADDFERRLTEISRNLKASMAVDAVGGDLTRQLVTCMPQEGHVIVYGGLSGEACPMPAGLLIFKQAVIQGFWLSLWLRKQSPWKLLQLGRTVQKYLSSELKTEIRATHRLEEIHAALDLYRGQMSGGKILLRCRD